MFKTHTLYLFVHVSLINTVLIARCSTARPGYLTEKLFATKTPYQRSRDLFKDFLSHVYGEQHSKAQLTDEKLYPDVCTPKQLSLLLRHGTRYPSSGDIRRVAKFLEKFTKLDLKEPFSQLKDWENDFTSANEKLLAVAGTKENIEIATRFANAFPDLFKKAVSKPDSFEFIASGTQRTIASAEGFAAGLAEALNQGSHLFMSNLQTRNDLLRFFENCSAYKYKVEDNDDAAIEFSNFKRGDLIQQAARSLSKRVSSNGREDLFNGDDLRSLWVICGFETALRGQGKDSLWCDMLTTEETHVLEYAWDLKSFWRKAHGYTLNYEQACPLLTDIMQNFHHASRNESAPVVSLYFGHAETLLPLQALLGLFQDEDVLTASNFEKNRIRKFRTSLTASFASNLALVMYDCHDSIQKSHADWPEQPSPVMVQVLANEHVIHLPFSERYSAVSIEQFENSYYQYVNHCNYDKICENHAESQQKPHDEL